MHDLHKQRQDELYCQLLIEENLSPELAEREAFKRANRPLTPENREKYRLIPNEFVRCALFRVANPAKERTYLRLVKLHVQASRDGSITYTGEELRQDDRKVFLETLHAEHKTPGIAIIKPRQLCRDMGWGDSNTALKHLEACLLRLKATALVIAVPRFPMPVTLSLITRIEQLETGELAIYFDDEIRALFSGYQFTRIVLNYQVQLNKRANLASWLLGFYSSHREPKEMLPEELHKLCGSSASQKEFKRMLKQALEHLKEVGFLTEYSIDKEVYVTRS